VKDGGASSGPVRASACGRQRILLVLVAGIGDFVLATPTVRAIAARFSDADITFLTTPQAAILARPCPYLHDVVTFDLRAYRPGERGIGWGGWQRFRAVATDLRSRRFSLAVNLYHVATWMGAARMALLLFRIGAGTTAGRWSRGRGVIFHLRSPDRPHEMDAMLALAGTLECRPDGAGPTLWVPESSRRSAHRHLEASDIPRESPYLVLHFGSNKPEARLPEDKAVSVGKALGCATDLPVLLTGDAGEAAATERLATRIGAGARSLAGRTDLLELAAIFEGARAAVTTDSGPMHVAAAVGAPLVALFGPGNPRRFGPRGRTGQIAVLQGRRYPHDPERWHTDIQAPEVVDALLTRVRAARAPAKD
jgi:ADP-heptose:LPS heptosyltransferase